MQLPLRIFWFDFSSNQTKKLIFLESRLTETSFKRTFYRREPALPQQGAGAGSQTVPADTCAVTALLLGSANTPQAGLVAPPAPNSHRHRATRLRYHSLGRTWPKRAVLVQWLEPTSCRDGMGWERYLERGTQHLRLSQHLLERLYGGIAHIESVPQPVHDGLAFSLFFL